MRIVYITSIALAVALLFPRGSEGGGDGFDLSRHSIEPDQILSGGPPKDGIPAIMTPEFVTAPAADFLRETDRVVGVLIGGQAKAYPIKILNWHEVVNDKLGKTPIAVTYCPLTGSAVVFERLVGDDTLSFGVSGRLYESNVLLYDHQGESLWSQLASEAVTGSSTGTTLQQIPAVLTSWGAWQASHPETLVLSPKTGHPRDYDANPYAAYESSGSLMFRSSRRDPRLLPKDRVLGVVVGNESRAYPLSELEMADTAVTDTLGGQQIIVTLREGTATAMQGDSLLEAIELYWFAWAAFHPHTSVWRSEASPPCGATQRLDDAKIVESKSYWTSLGAAFSAAPGSDPMAAVRSGLFVLSGRLKNDSDLPIHHVLLRFELIDTDGIVVHRYDGYNRSAEGLRFVEGDPAPEKTRAKAVPIGPHDTDSYRMIFIGDEIPSFDHPRVSIVSVE
jgi:hypothetical protein